MTSLPAFTAGTEKQIAWATKIRDSFIASAQDQRIVTDLDGFMVVVATKLTTDAAKWADAFTAINGCIDSRGMLAARKFANAISAASK